MKTSRIVVVCLVLTAGPLLLATLVGIPASLAAEPPPTETPEKGVTAPSKYPLDLVTQPPILQLHGEALAGGV